MKAVQAWHRFRVPLLWGSAIAFGLLGATGARNYIAGELDAEKRRLSQGARWAEVVVAKRALGPGERITADTMAVRRVAVDFAPAGVVGPAEFSAFEGESIRAAMQPGEPLFASAVARRSRASLASRIPPGTRAMTISVDEVNSVSGMLEPGDRIDLMFAVRAQKLDMSVPAELATPLMSNLSVLATGRRTDHAASDPGRYTSITVEVTPDQAQRLILAQRSGRITALLRRPGDTAREAREPLDLRQLLGLARESMDQGPEMIVGGRGPLPAARAPAPAPMPELSRSQEHS